MKLIFIYVLGKMSFSQMGIQLSWPHLQRHCSFPSLFWYQNSHKSSVHIYTGKFLGSLFHQSGLSLSLSQHNTLLVTIALWYILTSEVTSLPTLFWPSEFYRRLKSSKFISRSVVLTSHWEKKNDSIKTWRAQCFRNFSSVEFASQWEFERRPYI